MKIKYSLENYIEGVKAFNKETMEWSYLDDKYQYIASGNVSEPWEKSCDNAHGGLYISWAFKKENLTNEEILEHYYEELIDILRLDMENEVDNIEYIEINYKEKE